MDPLTVPELLSIVCGNLDKSSLLKATLVSRLWSTVCKPLVWRQCCFTAEIYSSHQPIFDSNAHFIHSISAKRRLIGGDMRFIAQQCVNLRVLNLVDCRMTPASFDILCDGIPHVRSLTLEHCIGVNSRMVTKLNRLTHLAELSIMVHTQERGHGDWREDELAQLLVRSPLRSLHIVGPDLSHIHLQALERSPEPLSLEHLYLHSTFISPNALAVLLQKSNGLKTLILLHNAIKNSTIQAIAENCTTLTKLGLRQTKSVSSTGFEVLFERSPWLTSLDISNTLVQDAAIVSLSRHCPKLQVLNLSHCTRLTGIRELLESLVELRDLCLTGCSRLQVQALSGSKPWASSGSLEVLDISHTGIRMVPMEGLIDRLQQLKRLRVLIIDEFQRSLKTSNAIQDAVTLANWINVLPANASADEIKKVFKAYKAERLPVVVDRFRISQTNSALLTKTFQGKAARYVLTNFPKWLIEKAAYDNVRCRSMISFLPLVEDIGSLKPSKQPSLDKTLAILQKREGTHSSSSSTLSDMSKRSNGPR
ncbi:hypothetical protein BG004_006365 [Podila humilis]|nr:hypothetical protein BG004_006365 [Podila humilis]